MLRNLRASTPVIAGFVLLSVGIFFGEVWGLYENIRHFDKTLHLLGILSAAAVAMTALVNVFRYMDDKRVARKRSKTTVSAEPAPSLARARRLRRR
jgi:hypothetical protein